MFQEGQYLTYAVGDPTIACHIDAVHAASPKADAGTGQIVTRVIQQTGAAGIVSKVSRKKMDLNRPRTAKNAPAIDEYRAAIREILESKGLIDPQTGLLVKRYLHLGIHGMHDHHGSDFEIGSRFKTSCDEAVLHWFYQSLATAFPEARIGVDQIFAGDPSKAFHRQGDPASGYGGYGGRYNAIQLEISGHYRKTRTHDIVEFLAHAINTFDAEFNPVAT